MLSRLAQLGSRLGAGGGGTVAALWGPAAAEAAAAAAALRGTAAAAGAAAARCYSSAPSHAALLQEPVHSSGAGLAAFGFLRQLGAGGAAWQRPRGPCAAGSAPAPAPGGALGGARAQQARGFQPMPRRIKYRKAFKSMGFNETRCPNTRQLAWGAFGIRAVEHARVPARTIEAVRRTLRRTIGKGAMLWIRMTPNVPVTSKPAEVRMGKGKGAVDYWAAPVRAGQIIFEFDRVPRKAALGAAAAVARKLPMRVGFVEWS